MKLGFADRADMAYHSLSEREQKRVRTALSKIDSADDKSIWLIPALSRLPQARDKKLWVLRVSPQLRLVASIEDGVFRVEDIVPSDRLDLISGRYNQ
jgi:hypothetical protein